MADHWQISVHALHDYLRLVLDDAPVTLLEEFCPRDHLVLGPLRNGRGPISSSPATINPGGSMIEGSATKKEQMFICY